MNGKYLSKGPDMKELLRSSRICGSLSLSQKLASMNHLRSILSGTSVIRSSRRPSRSSRPGSRIPAEEVIRNDSAILFNTPHAVITAWLFATIIAVTADEPPPFLRSLSACGAVTRHFRKREGSRGRKKSAAKVLGDRHDQVRALSCMIRPYAASTPRIERMQAGPTDQSSQRSMLPF